MPSTHYRESVLKAKKTPNSKVLTGFLPLQQTVEDKRCKKHMDCDPAVRDLDIWGNKHDDRLVGLKARLNHAQTLFGRYGLWLTAGGEHQVVRRAGRERWAGVWGSS